MKKKDKSAMPMILTLCLASLIGIMNGTIFNVALPALMRYFQTDVTMVQWLSSGYMLAAGIVTPAVAFFGNRFGYKKLLQAVTVATVVLAVVGSFSVNIQMLIVVRILFGLTAGMMMPLGMAMVYMVVPPHQQAGAAGVLSASLIVGGALPAVLSGVFITYLSWHWLLWMMIPLCLILLVSATALLPTDSNIQKQRMDGTGFLITGMGSFILLFSFSNLSGWGFVPKFFGLTAIGIACLVLYVVTRWTREDAMLNLEVLRYPRYAAALIVDVMNTIATYMVTFVMPLFLQSGMGFSAAKTGAIMLPCSIITIFAMPIATKVLRKYGEKGVAMVGIAVLVTGSAIFLRPWAAMPVLLIVFGMCVRSFGLGFISMMATNATMSSVPPTLSGHASALLNWQKQMVGALTTSIAGNVIAIRLLSHQAETAEQIAGIYLSSTGLLMLASIVMLLCMLPITLKYFRGGKEMKEQENA